MYVWVGGHLNVVAHMWSSYDDSEESVLPSPTSWALGLHLALASQLTGPYEEFLLDYSLEASAQ